MKNSKPGPKPISNIFGFIDEVGVLRTSKVERVFGLGLLRTQQCGTLHKAISIFRNKHKMHKELKFSAISEVNRPIYQAFIDIFFDTPDIKFSCIVLDKLGLNIDKHFKNDYFKAYNAFCSKLIADSLDTSENIAIMADDIDTPKSDNFEKEIKAKVKVRTRRNALFGICRTESKAISEIQMTDVLLGLVAYAFKIEYGLIKPQSKNPKLKLVKYLQKRLEIQKIAQSNECTMKFGNKFSVKEIQWTMGL